MALDVLAEMGAAISQLNSQVRKPVGSIEGSDADTELGSHLLQLAEASLGGRLRATDLVSWPGAEPKRTYLTAADGWPQLRLSS